MNAKAIEYEQSKKFTLEFISGPIKGTRSLTGWKASKGKLD